MPGRSKACLSVKDLKQFAGEDPAFLTATSLQRSSQWWGLPGPCQPSLLERSRHPFRRSMKTKRDKCFGKVSMHSTGCRLTALHATPVPNRRSHEQTPESARSRVCICAGCRGICATVRCRLCGSLSSCPCSIVRVQAWSDFDWSLSKSGSGLVPRAPEIKRLH